MFNSTSNTIKYVNDSTALVTKAFEKRACIFGTPEFKLWREYKALYPEAKMITKTIKRNPDKRTTRNLTYENMAAYIRTQDNAKVLMLEFELAVKRSKIQTNPYRCVLAWFEKTFEGYDDYKAYFDMLSKDKKTKADIYRLDDEAMEQDEDLTDEVVNQ